MSYKIPCRKSRIDLTEFGGEGDWWVRSATMRDFPLMKEYQDIATRSNQEGGSYNSEEVQRVIVKLMRSAITNLEDGTTDDELLDIDTDLLKRIVELFFGRQSLPLDKTTSP